MAEAVFFDICGLAEKIPDCALGRVMNDLRQVQPWCWAHSQCLKLGANAVAVARTMMRKMMLVTGGPVTDW